MSSGNSLFVQSRQRVNLVFACAYPKLGARAKAVQRHYCGPFKISGEQMTVAGLHCWSAPTPPWSATKAKRFGCTHSPQQPYSLELSAKSVVEQQNIEAQNDRGSDIRKPIRGTAVGEVPHDLFTSGEHDQWNKCERQRETQE